MRSLAGALLIISAMACQLGSLVWLPETPDSSALQGMTVLVALLGAWVVIFDHRDGEA